MASNRRRDASKAFALAVLASVALAAIGCGILRPTRGRHFEDAAHSGFLGDYSQLASQKGYAAQEVYVNPNAAWPDYHAIQIEAVTLWIADPSKQPKPDEQKALTDMLYKSLHDELAKSFEIVDHPGPGVIKLRAALTEAKGARVVLNTMTTVVPQLRTASTLAGLGTDTAALVGKASMEAEARDGITNERLAAVIDARAGTKGVTRMLFKWSDVEAICDHWGESAREFFVRQGVRQKR